MWPITRQRICTLTANSRDVSLKRFGEPDAGRRWRTEDDRLAEREREGREERTPKDRAPIETERNCLGEREKREDATRPTRKIQRPRGQRGEGGGGEREGERERVFFPRAPLGRVYACILNEGILLGQPHFCALDPLPCPCHHHLNSIL